MIISIDVEEAFDEIPYLLLRNQCFFTKVQQQFSREKTIFSQLFIHVPEMNFAHSSQHTQNELKMGHRSECKIYRKQELRISM